MAKVIVIVDMQYDFIDGSLGSAEAQAIVPTMIKRLKEYESEQPLVIFTKDTHKENYLETQEGKNLPVKHCIKDTFGWQISSKLDVADSVVIDKPTFGSTKLMEYLLSKQNISEIQLVGLCTDICVISNAFLLKAALPEVLISLDSRCCAGVTPESHNRALESMKTCQIMVI